MCNIKKIIINDGWKSEKGAPEDFGLFTVLMMSLKKIFLSGC